MSQALKKVAMLHTVARTPNFFLRNLSRNVLLCARLDVRLIFQHSSSGTQFKPGDCFVGYHSDTIAAVVMKNSDLEDNEQVLYLLFRCQNFILRYSVSKVEQN